MPVAALACYVIETHETNAFFPSNLVVARGAQGRGERLRRKGEGDAKDERLLRMQTASFVACVACIGSNRSRGNLIAGQPDRTGLVGHPARLTRTPVEIKDSHKENRFAQRAVAAAGCGENQPVLPW